MTPNKEHFPMPQSPQPAQPQQQMALPTIVPPGPMPTAFNVDAGDGPLLRLRCQTPLGVQVYWLDPDTADALSHHLRNGATRARSGLVVPDPTVRLNGKHPGK